MMVLKLIVPLTVLVPTIIIQVVYHHRPVYFVQKTPTHLLVNPNAQHAHQVYQKHHQDHHSVHHQVVFQSVS